MEKKWWWLVGFVLILAVCLRLPQLNGSFWLDEAAQTLESARPLSQQLNIRDDFQPPLLHLIVHFALQMNRVEWWLRLVGAVIPAILSIFGTILITRKILPKSFALQGSLLVGLLLATNSFHLFFSQELRPYALPMALAVWSWWCLLQKQQINKFKVGWMIVSIFGLYSSYLYPFLLLSQLVYIGVTNQGIAKLKLWAVGLLVIILSFAPWLPSFFGQLQAGQLLRFQLPQWENAVSTSQLKVLPLVFAKFVFGVLDVSVTTPFILISGVIILLILCALFGIWRQFRAKTVASFNTELFYVLCWLLIPLLVAWLISFFIPVVQPKRVLFLLPAFYLLIVWLFVKTQSLSFWFRRTGCALIGILLCVNLYSVYQYYTDPHLQRENWRGVISVVTKKYPQAFTLSSFPAPFAPIDWYRPRYINSPLAQDLASGSLYIESPMQAQQIIADITVQKMTNTMIYFEYLTDLTDPNHYIRDSIEASGYQLQDLLDYPGIGFVRIYQYTPIYALGH